MCVRDINRISSPWRRGVTAAGIWGKDRVNRGRGFGIGEGIGKTQGCYTRLWERLGLRVKGLDHDTLPVHKRPLCRSTVLFIYACGEIGNQFHIPVTQKKRTMVKKTDFNFGPKDMHHYMENVIMRFSIFTASEHYKLHET